MLEKGLVKRLECLPEYWTPEYWTPEYLREVSGSVFAPAP